MTSDPAGAPTALPRRDRERLRSRTEPPPAPAAPPGPPAPVFAARPAVVAVRRSPGARLLSLALTALWGVVVLGAAGLAVACLLGLFGALAEALLAGAGLCAGALLLVAAHLVRGARRAP